MYDQRGFSLLETSIGVAIAGLLAVGIMQYMAVDNQADLADATAKQLLTLEQVVANYVELNRAALAGLNADGATAHILINASTDSALVADIRPEFAVETPDLPKFPFVDKDGYFYKNDRPVSITSGLLDKARKPSIADLRSNGYLPDGFPDNARGGGKFQVKIVIRDPVTGAVTTACVQNGQCELQSLIWIDQPLRRTDGTTDYDLLGRITRQFGSRGGFSQDIDPAKPATHIYGLSARNDVKSSAWTEVNPVQNTPPGILLLRSSGSHDGVHAFAMARTATNSVTGQLKDVRVSNFADVIFNGNVDYEKVDLGNGNSLSFDTGMRDANIGISNHAIIEQATIGTLKGTSSSGMAAPHIQFTGADKHIASISAVDTLNMSGGNIDMLNQGANAEGIVTTNSQHGGANGKLAGNATAMSYDCSNVRGATAVTRYDYVTNKSYQEVNAKHAGQGNFCTQWARTSADIGPWSETVQTSNVDPAATTPTSYTVVTTHTTTSGRVIGNGASCNPASGNCRAH